MIYAALRSIYTDQGLDVDGLDSVHAGAKASWFVDLHGRRLRSIAEKSDFLRLTR